MATFDFRVLLETVEGRKTSYISQSFVDTSQDLVLSASQVYHRITGSVSCSYQNQSIFSGSNFNHLYTFKDSLILSASLTGSLNTGSIDFTSATSEYDRLLRYKFFGEKVCNTLGLPHAQWVYVDNFRLPADDSEVNVFEGNVNSRNLFIGDSLTFSNDSTINSDVPFLIDTGSDRHIKFIDERNTGTRALIIGYDKGLDIYEISGSNETSFSIGGLNKLVFADGTEQVTAGGGSGGTITALNNKAENRLVTIGSTTTELDGEANLTFDGTDLTINGNVFAANITASGDISMSAGQRVGVQPDQIGEGSDLGTTTTYNADNIQFHVADAEAVVIDNARRVGIGNSNPAKPLTVTGDISSSGDIFLEDNKGIQFGQTSENFISGSSNDIVIAAYDDIFFKGLNMGTEILHIRGGESIVEVTGTMEVSSHITASGNISASQLVLTSDDNPLIKLERNSDQNVGLQFQNTQGFMIAGIDNDAQNTGANIFGIGYVGDIIDNDGSDHATFVVTGSQVVINNATSASEDAALTVEGNISIGNGKLYGDEAYNNFLRFNASSSLFKVQDKTFIKMDGSSGQREVTINEGTNDIDFVVKGKSSVGNGNPLFHTDANTHKIGMHGVGGPTAGLHIADDLWVSGSNGHITASGNISASGTITGNSIVGTLTGTATGLAGTPDIVVGSLTATSITSSIVTSSILHTEGSNIFGDAISDTHLFNGHITASGDISASGKLYVTDDVDFDGDLDVDGTANLDDVTATGDVQFQGGFRSDGDFDLTNAAIDIDLTDNNASALSFDTNGKAGILELVTTNDSEKVKMSGGLEVTGNTTFTAGITASGNISSSGQVIAKSVRLNQEEQNGLQFSGTDSIYFSDNNDIRVKTSDADRLIVSDNGIEVKQHITASGNISSSLTSTGSLGRGEFQDFITVGDSSATSTGILVEASDSDTFYDGLEIKRKFPRIALTDTVGTDNTFHIWHLGDQLRFGSDAGGELNSVLTMETGTAADAFFNGKLGIGKKDATKQLEVAGDISSSGAINTLSHITASGNISVSETGSFGQINLADDKRIKLGDAGDLQIYHNGSNSVISDVGAGDLLINGANVRIRDANDGNTIALFTQGAGVEMRHDNTVRFETTTTGVKVSGDISMSDGGRVGFRPDGIGEGSDLGTTTTYNADNIQFHITDGEAVVIDNARRVGIGNSNPVKPLTITGDISSSGDIFLEDNKGIQFGQTSENFISGSSNDIVIAAYDDIFFKGLNMGTEILHIRGGESIVEVTGTIEVSSHITSSGNISSSGAITGLSGSFGLGIFNTSVLVGQSSFAGYGTVAANTNDLIVNGQFSAAGSAGSAIYKLQIGDTLGIPANEGDLNVGGDLTIGGAIVASGIISSSAQVVESLPFGASGIISGAAQLPSGIFSSSAAGSSQGKFKLNGVDIDVNGLGTDGDVTFDTLILDAGGLKGVGAFSSSLQLTGENLNLGNITASANISMSAGNIFVSDGAKIGFSKTQEFGDGDDTESAIKFNSANTQIIAGEKTMIHAEDGKVGIFTDTPNEVLQVFGNISASGNIITDGGIQLGYDNVNFISASINDTIIGSADNIIFKGNGSDQIMEIQGDEAKVNITGSLEVSGSGVTIHNGNQDGVLLIKRFSGNIGQLSAANTRFTVRALNNKDLSLEDDAGNIGVFVKDGGNVGIGGTTVPTVPLQVEGVISASGGISSSGHITINSPASKLLFRGDDTSVNHEIESDGNLYITVDDDNDDTNQFIQFRANGATNLMKIQDDGNVGIGTTAPTKKLQVAGDISASGDLVLGDIAGGNYISASAAGGNLEFTGAVSGSASSTFTIGGKLQAGSKSFLIARPEGGKLEYGALEGQQNDVFYRGELKGDNVIYLPKEWEWLVDENTITVQLTSIGKHQELFVKEIKENKIFININGICKGKNNIHCYYIIHGTRKDVELIRNYQ